MSYGLDTIQFRLHIVRPVLKRIGLWSQAAENLVVGTALQESRLKYVDQLDKQNLPGPAYGVFQMEAPTHLDIHNRFLAGKSELRRAVIGLAGDFAGSTPSPTEMVGNMNYACAMCRVHYYRVPEALPPANRADLLAQYWKRYYNTVLGKGTVEQARPHFERAVKEGAV